VKILGVIPARKGSKGIKDKNLITLGKMHLIEYTLQFTSKISQLDKVILTTDSDEIIEIGKKYNHVDIPF
jgi:CMP-N-acetylneuraminic acid synthetase